MIDIIKKEMIKRSNQLDKYIKTILEEKTGFVVKTKTDVLNLQKEYCILLYKYTDNLNAYDSYCRKQGYVLEVETPKPDNNGLHHMRLLGDEFCFSKSNDGRWIIEKQINLLK